MPFPKCIKLLGFIATVFSSALSETAQCQFSIEQPFFGGLQTSQGQFNLKSLVPDLAYWWVSADITNGWTVTNWLDRLQSYPLTNGLSANRPTNSANGVCFIGSKFLTNIAISPGAVNLSHFVIIKPITRTAIYEAYAGDYTTFYGFTRNTFRGWYAGWAGANENLSGNDVGTNVWMTLTMSEPTGSGTHSSYTNGIGAVGIPFASAGFPTFTSVGGNSTVGRFLDGYIREFGIITNTVNSVTASNIYWYSTNTYGL